MIQPGFCANCDSTTTERVYRDGHPSEDRAEHVYICHDCDAQYTVVFHATEKETDFIGEP